MAEVQKISDGVWSVDGVWRVGPGELYATVPSSLVTRAESATRDNKSHLSADQLNEIAIGALHVAATALTIDDPLRGDVVRLINARASRR